MWGGYQGCLLRSQRLSGNNLNSRSLPFTTEYGFSGGLVMSADFRDSIIPDNPCQASSRKLGKEVLPKLGQSAPYQELFVQAAKKSRLRDEIGAFFRSNVLLVEVQCNVQYGKHVHMRRSFHSAYAFTVEPSVRGEISTGGRWRKEETTFNRCPLQLPTRGQYLNTAWLPSSRLFLC